VSQCQADKLFDDAYQVDFLTKGAPQSKRGKKTEEELITFTDNYLQSKGMMKTGDYYKWKRKIYQDILRKTVHEKNLDKEEKQKREQDVKEFYERNYRYKRTMEAAKNEWLLSTDGVVNALRYDIKEKQFTAQIRYRKKKSTTIIEEKIKVTNDWVIDTYGKEVAKKIMDRAEHDDFIPPLNQDGFMVQVKLDERTICRVKYCPPKYTHVTDKKKKIEYVTDQVHVKEMWKGQLEDGTVIDLNEWVLSQFGDHFLEECKTLGLRKFVPIPVGSCRSSVINIVPGLKSSNAP
jgi:hypothetical protein